MKHSIVLFLCFTALFACRKVDINKDRTERFPKPIDTQTLPVTMQERKVWQATENVAFSNTFDGARLNGVTVLNDSTFQLTISPENFPINPSPWYSFKVWEKTPKRIFLNFVYENGKHRYAPKLSTNGKNWRIAEQFNEGKTQLIVEPFSDTLHISAQELFTKKELSEWANSLPNVKQSSVGTTPLKNEIMLIELNPETEAKDVIVFFSRQHPPEVTGQFALNSYVETLMEKNPQTATFLKNYRVLVFPMLNPDGVQEGHWRHNTGGVDLNRDWDVYNQPETRQIAEYLVAQVKKNDWRIVLGIDFHSTYEDVYYTNLTDATSHLPNFTDTWLKLIQERVPNYVPKIAPSNVGQPVSKGWFYVQFGAVGITYEIGDDTDRDFIKVKSEVAAKAMMEILNK
jgi:predicted deacylase